MRNVSPTAIRVLVVTLGVGLVAMLGGLIDGLNRDLYDRALRWRALRQPVEPKPYVLVEIDDRSIDALGRFPWSRREFAELLDRTREGGADVVGLDVVFAEPADPQGDAALAGALRSAGNVVLASAPVLAPPERQPSSGARGGVPVVEDLVEPIPELAAAAAGVGSVAILEDSDGVMRRYSFLVRHRRTLYPSLAQLVAGVARGGSVTTASLEGDGTMLINYGSLSPGAVVRVSFSDVLGYGAEDVRRLFDGRIVLVGATYTAGTDYGPTPLDPRTPRVFAQLYAVHTLVTGRHLAEVPAAVPFLLALLVVGLLSTQIPARHPLQLLGMGTALVAVLLGGTFALYLALGVVVGPALPVLALGVVVSGYGLEEWWATNLNLRKRNVELVETLDNLRRTRSAKERMEAELSIAREIQFSMLPPISPAIRERSEFALNAMLVPALEVGGDFYDFFLVDDDHLCVCVADVSGKGVPAALFMAVSKAIIKSVASREPSPSVILTRANAELVRDNEASMFVSVWLGILDARSGELAYANAGHNPPYLRTAGGDPVRLDARHGPVVAAVDSVEYGEDTITLAPGDMVVLYTDGVAEARDPEGALYGERRFRELLRSSAAASAEDLVNAAAEDVWRFQDSALQADDLTLIALQYTGNGVRAEGSHAPAARAADPPEGGAGGAGVVTVHLELENRLEEIRRVNEAFEELVEGSALPVEVRRSVKLALDDVLNNIISYAYPDEDRHVIEVDLEHATDRVTVRVADDGHPFDPLSHASPDTALEIDDRRVGGLGIHLVQNVMDEVSYARRSGRNVTVLVKHVPGRARAPHEGPDEKGAFVDITTSEKDGVTLVRIAGNLDTGTAPAAQEALDALVEEGSRKILIDFEELDYVSSAGLRVLLVTAKRLRGSGGTLRFCSLNESVTDVFRIAGFDGIFDLFASEAEALEDF